MSRAIFVLLFCGIALSAADEPHRRTAGKYQVTLRLPPDGLYAQEEVEIEVRLEDTTRPDSLLGFAPVIRAQVNASIEMPAMPGMPPYRESAHTEGVPGDYGFHPTFAHGGEYLLRLDVAPPEDQAFHIEFPIQVLDADRTGRRKKLPPRFWLELTASPKSPKAGEAVDLALVVRAREQPKQGVASFDIAHEKLMHLVVVRADLTQFAHEHPDLGTDGMFRLRRTFSEPGEYRLFADVAPKGAGSQILMATLKVSGKGTGSPSVNEFGITLKPSEPLRIRTSTRVEVSLRDLATASPVVNLQNYLGAAGHLFLIHDDATTFVHSHPMESAENPLTFLVRPPKPGRYHGWLQVQRENRIVTTAFTLDATEPRE